MGRERNDFADSQGMRYKTDSLAGELHRRFIDTHGSVTCQCIQRRILGRPFYLRDPDSREKFLAAGGHEGKCTSAVGETARWTVEILADNGYLA